MDKIERLQAELAQAEEAVDFWRMVALAERDRAERAERELEWGHVDATTYTWNRAMVRMFLPARCGMSD